MPPRRKAWFVAAGISASSFVVNFLVFVVAYRHVAFPYLTEEQRVANADYIMTVVTGSFLLVAILVGVAVHWLSRPAADKS